MVEAEVQLFAVALEVHFSRPRPLAQDKLDEVAAWLTDASEGLALRPEQIRVRRADILFDYELTASFFGGNATFRQDAEKSLFSARGARTRQDAGILQQTAVRFVTAVAAPDQLHVGRDGVSLRRHPRGDAFSPPTVHPQWNGAVGSSCPLRTACFAGSLDKSPTEPAGDPGLAPSRREGHGSNHHARGDRRCPRRLRRC